LKKIATALETFNPEFIIYNAGTDTLSGDPLGRLSLSKDCLIKRDEYIINLGINHKIPVTMVLSGGYQKTNAGVIA
jgi:histone deacetylase 11